MLELYRTVWKPPIYKEHHKLFQNKGVQSQPQTWVNRSYSQLFENNSTTSMQNPLSSFAEPILLPWGRYKDHVGGLGLRWAIRKLCWFWTRVWSHAFTCLICFWTKRCIALLLWLAMQRSHWERLRGNSAGQRWCLRGHVSACYHLQLWSRLWPIDLSSLVWLQRPCQDCTCVNVCACYPVFVTFFLLFLHNIS